MDVKYDQNKSPNTPRIKDIYMSLNSPENTIQRNLPLFSPPIQAYKSRHLHVNYIELDLQTSRSFLSPIHTADADATKLFCRVTSASAVCTWIRDDCRRIRRCERITQPLAVTQFTTADGCVHTDDTTKLSPTSCEFVFTPPTRRDSTVSSRRRCVLGISFFVCLLNW